MTYCRAFSSTQDPSCKIPWNRSQSVTGLIFKKFKNHLCNHLPTIPLWWTFSWGFQSWSTTSSNTPPKTTSINSFRIRLNLCILKLWKNSPKISENYGWKKSRMTRIILQVRKVIIWLSMTTWEIKQNSKIVRRSKECSFLVWFSQVWGGCFKEVLKVEEFQRT